MYKFSPGESREQKKDIYKRVLLYMYLDFEVVVFKLRSMRAANTASSAE